MHAVLCAALSAFALASARDARADATPDASARADALFARGKTDMAAGRYVTACAAFTESLSLEPAEGTLLALALCHEKEGELVRAWNELRDVASRTDRDDRRRVARAAVARVEPRIGRVVVTVPREATGCAASLRIDERPVTAGEAAHEIAVSTGDHRLACDRAAGGPFTATFVATAGAVAQVAVPAGDPVGPSSSSAPPPSPTATTPAVAPVVVGEARPSPRAGAPVLGYVLGGAGIAALGVGAFFGVRALGDWKTVEAKCDPAACHDASAAADAKVARTDATIANVGIVAGAVLVGTGLVLVLTHASAPESAVGRVLRGGGRVAF